MILTERISHEDRLVYEIQDYKTNYAHVSNGMGHKPPAKVKAELASSCAETLKHLSSFFRLSVSTYRTGQGDFSDAYV